MHKFFTILFLSIILTSNLIAQRIQLDTLGVLHRDLKEISGIQKTERGNIWTHNDSGNKPYIYQIDGDGKILKSVFIKNAINVDWEDIAADGFGYVYIADIGNNKNDRQDLIIYKIKEDDLLKKDTALAEKISFSYSDQVAFPPDKSKMNYDAEALVYSFGSLFIFTKNRADPFTGYSIIHEIPSMPGSYQSQKVDSILVGESMRELNQITGADISPDGKRMVLMSYDKMLILHEYPYRDFTGGRTEIIEFANLSQKESVAFINDSIILLADEKSVLGGGNMYSYNLSSHIKTNSEIRRNEVNIPIKAFGDTLLVELNTEVRGKVFYEFFNNDGTRVDAGTVGFFERGAHKFNLTPPPFLNGTYMVNIQVGKRPHAFFVYRFTGVDWEKVRSEFEKKTD